jgi:L-threonylcarbamoyladenylate synthase
MPYTLKINPENPDPFLVEEVLHILRTGGIIAYPTETFYGLGCDGENEKAVEQIFLLKGRLITSPISVIVGKISDALSLIREIPLSGQKLIETFWPGPLTLVFKASTKVPPLLTADTGKIGIRISSHPVAALLAEAFSHPITATSANVTGAGESCSADDVIQSFGDRLGAIIDAGPTNGGKGSTIIDMTVDPPLLLREGVISFAVIQNCLHKV